MRHAWIYLGFLDAQLPLSQEERRDVGRRAYLHARSDRRFMLKLALATLVLPAAVAGLGYILVTWLEGFFPIRFAAPIGVLGACAICIFLFARLVWAWKTRFMRMAIRDLGYDVCARCGYWLRELGEDVKRCPECGAARERMPSKINP